MTSFEAGFFKAAEERGLSLEETIHVFKRAMEHPQANQMFKDLPEDEAETHNDMSVLADLLKHEFIDKQMSTASKQLAI
jgi:hypothetical protein